MRSTELHLSEARERDQVVVKTAADLQLVAPMFGISVLVTGTRNAYPLEHEELVCNLTTLLSHGFERRFALKHSERDHMQTS